MRSPFEHRVTEEEEEEEVTVFVAPLVGLALSARLWCAALARCMLGGRRS